MDQETISSCRYTIHFPPSQSASLPSLLVDLQAFTSTLSSSYIWHNPPGVSLSLSPLSFSSASTSPQYRFIEGTTNCSDAVDDEWFLVWLLREISRVWEDAVVQVEDEDGEFLLIEGAEELPKWVTPDNAANRVWIHQQQLHLVPLEHSSTLPFAASASDSASATDDPSNEGFLDRVQALNLVRDPSIPTVAPKALQDIVWARINGYPAKIDEHHHKTIAYLPREVALALSDSPGLAAEAIGAFYERDPDGLRACNAMKRFPPSSPSEAFLVPPSESQGTVKVLATLTRPLYSQLVLQRFFAPKPFEKVGWMNGADGTKLTEEDERRRSVGLKITCGFEILYALTAPQLRVPTSTSSTGAASIDPSAPAYKAFLARLDKTGYFGDEIQGSKVWSEKELAARAGWAKSAAGGAGAVEGRSNKSFAQRVDEAIQRAKSLPLPSQLPSQLPRQSAGTDTALEGSEEWLVVDEDGLEDMLRRRGPGAGGLGESDLEDESDESEEEGEDGMEGVEGVGMEEKERRKAERVAKKLEGMAGKVEEFIHGRGAVDGAEFSDEQSDDDPDSDDELPTLTPEERASRLATLVPSLPISEWGQKDPSPSPSTPAPPLSTPTAPLPLPPRAPKLTTNTYDGASSEESSDEDDRVVEGEEGLGEDEGEDGPAVMDMDMQEEMDEFLKFATETLGLSEEQYGKILGERKSRGAFVPGPSKAKKVNVGPPSSSSKAAPTPAPTPAAPKSPPPPRVPLRNPNLTDFDALMEQMDAELARSRAPSSSIPPPSSSSKPTHTFSKPSPKPSTSSSTSKAKSSSNIVIDSDPDDDSDDEMGAMDSELAELFKTVGGEGGREGGADGPVDYNLVKNFLESFQSQGGVPASAEAVAPLVAADDLPPSLPPATLTQSITALPMADLVAVLSKYPLCVDEVSTAAAPFHTVLEEKEFWKDPWNPALSAVVEAYRLARTNGTDPSAVETARLAARSALRRITARVAVLTIKRGDWKEGVERIVQLNNKRTLLAQTQGIGGIGVDAASESDPYDPALAVVRLALDDLPVVRKSIATMTPSSIGTELFKRYTSTASPALEREWDRLWDGDLDDRDAVFPGASSVPRPTQIARTTTDRSPTLFSTLPPEIVSMIIEEGADNAEAKFGGGLPARADRRQTFLKVASRVNRVWRDLSQPKLWTYLHFRSVAVIDDFVSLPFRHGRTDLVRKVVLQLDPIFQPQGKTRRSHPLYKTICHSLQRLWSTCGDVRAVELCSRGSHVLEYRSAFANAPLGPAKLPRPPRATFLPDHITTLSLVDFNFGFSDIGLPLILQYVSTLPIKHLTITGGKFEDSRYGRPSDLRISTHPFPFPSLDYVILDDSFPVLSLLVVRPSAVTHVVLQRPTPAERYAGYGQPTPPRPLSLIKEAIYLLPAWKTLQLPGTEKEALWGDSAEILANVAEGVEVRWET
ncbi:hypothetical protein RQP46_010757 [Phenoliferia psychrophenolica]